MESERHKWDAAYRERHRDRVREQQRAYRARNRERLQAEDRQRYLQRRDIQQEAARVKYATDSAFRDAARARSAARARNPTEQMRQRRREAWQRRRARKQGRTAERIDRALVFERDAGICGICGDAVDPTAWDLDHVTPIAGGGSHTYGNVQVSHPFCNRSKGARFAEVA